MDDLTPTQQAAVSQLRELTNGSDEEVAINVLRSVDWDVERAADLVFGGGGGVPSNAGAGPSIAEAEDDHVVREVFEIDDTEQGHDYHPPPQPSPLGLIIRPIFSILTLPFSLISHLFRIIFNVLRIPFPNLRIGTGLTRFSLYTALGRTRPTNRGGADRWIRELEEETGAISIGRLRASKGVSSGVSEAGPSSGSGLSSRGAGSGGEGNGQAYEEGRRLLPDFVSGTYEEALKTCQKDIRIGCIILVSEEHDDVAEFKRSTLTDPTFVKALQGNDVLVWGGDVRDVEAWSAAEKLQATTYPFVAFLALQPRRTVGSSNSHNSPPSLTVLSRHQGPSTGPTSAETLTTHLASQVIPRVSSYLTRLKHQQAERERDRALREEQDRAFQEAARRDTERIQAAMRAEKEQKEVARQAEEARKREQERLRREEEERERVRAERMQWRRWTRFGLGVKAEQTKIENKNLRIAIRLPDGSRLIQQFSGEDTLTTLYATVDANLIPPSYPSSDDPSSPPQAHGQTQSTVEEILEKTVLKSHTPTSATSEHWLFRIASAFPRAEIPWERGVKLSTISHLKGGGQVVVEMVNNRTASRRSLEKEKQASPQPGASGQDNDGSDGYDTEED